MQLWYTCKNNELNGPYSQNEVDQLLKKGELTANDWLRRQEEPQWSIAGKHEIAYRWFAESLHVEETALQVRWVVLKQIGDSYTQLGPFSQVEVLDRIYLDELNYNDFIWCEGFKDWQRIGSLENFIPQKKESEVLSEKPTEQLDLFSNVLIQKTAAISFYDVEPNTEIEMSDTEDSYTKPIETVKKNETGIPGYYKIQPSKKKKWWFLSFFCLFLTLLIAVWGQSGLDIYL